MADTIGVDVFVKRLAPDCPGGPNFLKKQAVAAAAAEFFRQTRAWREFVHEAAYVDAFTREISADRVARHTAGGYAALLDINGVWLSDGTRLQERARTFLNKGGTDWREDAAEKPTGYFFTPERKIRVYPSLKKGVPILWLDMEMVLVPTMDAETMPRFAWDFYGETILAGAAQRLKSQPGASWSNPEQARFFLKQFQMGIREARREKAKRVADAINERRCRCFR